MFGLRRKKTVESPVVEAPVEPVAPEPEPQPETFAPALTGGPFSADEVDADVLTADSRLDLGSVNVPVPPGGQVQVEMAPDGSPQAVHLMLPFGRVTVAAYAAPKTPGTWDSVIGDLSGSMEAQSAALTLERGPWGNELVALTQQAEIRFIGVDGYRWMIRLVQAGPQGSSAADSDLTKASRAILSSTVVSRGNDPFPPKSPLPIRLPKAMAEQLKVAHEMRLQQQKAQEQAQSEEA
jgi:hypothetical protein